MSSDNGTRPLPCASPPLVSTAMDLPAPDRFSKNLRVSCRFGAAAPAMPVHLREEGRRWGSLSPACQGEDKPGGESDSVGTCGRRDSGVFGPQWSPPSARTHLLTQILHEVRGLTPCSITAQFVVCSPHISQL